MELGDNIVILKNVKGDPIMSKGINSRKVAVIGTGFVGSSSAFALMESGLFTEMVLIDADKNRAEGEALDIAHGLPFARPMKITAGDYDDIVDAAIIVVTAGPKAFLPLHPKEYPFLAAIHPPKHPISPASLSPLPVPYL